jgi:hypothetical protein
MPALPTVAGGDAGGVEPVGDRPERESTSPLPPDPPAQRFLEDRWPAETNALRLLDSECSAGSLADEAPLQLGEHSGHVSHGLAGGGGEVDPQVKGDQVPAFEAGQFDGLSGVDDRAGEPIELGDDQAARLPAADRLESGLQPGPVGEGLARVDILVEGEEQPATGPAS